MSGLETRNPKLETRPRGERDESDYVIETALKVLKVLECLEGSNFEPVSIKRVAQRCRFNRSFVRSALITLKKAGWAKELLSGQERLFVHGSKADNLVRKYSAKLVADPQTCGS